MRAVMCYGIALACVLCSSPTATAQEGGLSVELGAARAFPPSGTDAAQASYGMLGLRAERWNPAGSGLWASVHGGLALDQAASNWGSAEAGVQLWTRVGGPVDLGLGGDVYAFSVSEPFVHKAVTGTLDGQLRVRLDRVQFLLNGEGGVGRSVLEVVLTDIDRLIRNGLDRLPDGSSPIRRAEQQLWHYGGGPELRLVGSRSVASLSAGVYESPRGTYRQASASVAGFLGAGSEAIWRVVVSTWNTPIGDEVTGGLAVSFPLGGGWSASASGLRTEPSPLIRTNGGTHGGVVLHWKPIAWESKPRSVYQLARRGGEATAEFKLERLDASTVEVVGDFTGWEPVAMRGDQDRWLLALAIKPGVYHFGFLVDGEWYLPEDGIPGRVSDEWGRDNGTLIVPEQEDGDKR